MVKYQCTFHMSNTVESVKDAMYLENMEAAPEMKAQVAEQST